ncbi:MAG: serine hydrolase domain-containing protein [Lysobacteraceae bacterium]
MNALHWPPKFCRAVLALACLIGCGPIAQAEVDAASFATTFQTVLADNGIPGGAWAIVRDGRIVASGAHGVRRLGEPEPVSAETVFRIASVSKTFAAQIGAMLVDEGRLHWNDPVTNFVPSFRLKRPGQAGKLQLQHLLGQSTGIVPNAFDNLLEADQPLARILPQFATLEPICPLGNCYTYQNILFSLVEPAYEESTGDDYPALLHQRLFQPLGMSHASVGLDAWNALPDRAEPHIRRRGAWQTATVAAGYYRVAPAAGINASAHDMARWLLAQMDSHPDVVTPTQVETLTRKRIATPRELRRHRWKSLLSEAHYGLGWRLYTLGDEELVLHSGWVQGFVAEIAYSPARRSGLVVLLNGETRAISDITTAFWSTELGIQPRPEAP